MKSGFEEFSPSVELTRMAAEKVMGWKDVAVRQFGGSGPRLFGKSTRPSLHEYEQVPDYSTRIEDALDVVAAMEKLGPDVYARFVQECTSYQMHKVVRGASVVDAWAYADPIDICEAALIAIDSKI